MIELLIIIISIVYIWEHSGFMYDLGKFLYTKLNRGKVYKGQPIIKPFGCYTCMVFWITTIHYYAQTQPSIVYAIGVGTASSILAMLIDKILMIIIRCIHRIS